MAQKFIVTQDSETRTELIRMGFKEVSKNHGTYTFLNNGRKFAKFEKQNLNFTYTNKICI